MRRFSLMVCVLIFFGLPSSLYAQQTGGVTGVVSDVTTAQPLSGVEVAISDTRLSTLTDARGTYRIDGVALGTIEVQVQSIGYVPARQTLVVQPGEAVVADFSLSVSAVALDAMVVTVTGPQRRRALGNSAVTINGAEEMAKAAPTTFSSLLQGRAPGVQVLQSSGTVGGSASIKIRGNNSISLNDTPLIYIDGLRVSNDMRSGPGVGGQNTSRLNDLNLDDIESVDIVKGPSAATLYGTEAAAGVIRITTKQGRAGPTQWTIRSELGANWDATEWPSTAWNPRSFYGEEVDVSTLLPAGTVPEGQFFAQIPDTLYALNLLLDGTAGDSVYGTPWRTGIEQSQSLSLRGGAGNVTYFLSGEFSHRQGNLSNNEVTQRSMRANVHLTPSDELGILLSTVFASNKASLPDNDNSTFGYIGVGLLGFPWTMSIKRPDQVSGSESLTCPAAVETQRALLRAGLSHGLDEFADSCADNPFFGERTFEDVATLVNDQKIERFNGSVTADYRPFDFMTLRGTLGYDEFSDQTVQFIPVDAELPFNDLSRGFKTTSTLVTRNLTVDASASATFELLPDLRWTTSAGGQFFRQKFESTAALGRRLPPGTTTVSNAVTTQGYEGIGEGRTFGLYVQQQWGYRDRLFLTPAIRFDESSTFGVTRPKVGYPRVMASWVVSEESWFDLIPAAIVPSLRLRGAWGRSGKEPASFAALQVLGARRVTFREQDVAGVVLTSPGNPYLKPERGEEIELGFDAALFEGRVGLDFTWFRQITKDALVARPVAPSTGFASAKAENVAEVRNSGMELGLSAVAWNAPGLRWDWSLNLSSTSGEVTELEEPIIFGLGGNSQRIQEGHPFASYFSRTYSLEDGSPVASDSAVFVGQPTPKVEGSVSTSVALFGWLTLSANLGFATGHQQFNSTQEFRCGFLGGGTYGGVCTEIFEVGEDGERTDQAKIKAAASDDLQFAPWIEDADFARLRSVAARFELPSVWMGRLGATGGSFTIMGENIALFTNYSGLDPEVNYAGGSQSSRAEFFTLPLAKRVVMRLSIEF
jgi:TonB-linked SusC/RagA family outer membrane protein